MGIVKFLSWWPFLVAATYSFFAVPIIIKFQYERFWSIIFGGGLTLGMVFGVIETLNLGLLKGFGFFDIFNELMNLFVSCGAACIGGVLCAMGAGSLLETVRGPKKKTD